VATPVVELTGPTLLRAGEVYVVAPTQTAVFDDGLLVPRDAPAIGRIDQLIRSIAEEVGRCAAGVLVAGRGRDGALGLKRIKEQGGLTVVRPPTPGAEHELSRAAISSSVIDLVQSPEQIGVTLATFVTARPELGIDDDRQAAADAASTALRDLLTVVRIRTGHDFSSYKRATLYRRVARRMLVCQTATFADYNRYLREHAAELGNLVRDFLISVTNFFRDPDAFGSLAEQIVPRMFAGKSGSDSVRVWVAGCATGEEAYTIAMLLDEYARGLAEPPAIQIFATDIDEQALAEARMGRYSDAIAIDLSQERLDRYFTPDNGGYRVHKELRERVLFSPHSVLRDPPFSRLDLISCRNLMIYLDRDGQDHALAMFHFGLRADGFLFLGSSESAEGSALFSPLDPKHRIFVRRISSTAINVDAIVSSGRWQPRLPPIVPALHAAQQPSFGELHHQVVERYAPPSVLVNDELEIVHVSEHAGKFLEVVGGEPTRQLLGLVHPGLRIELRAAIYAARQSPRHGDTRVIRFEDHGEPRAVEVRVRAIDVPELGPQALLVMFDDSIPEGALAPDEATVPGTQIEPVVRELENELRYTRDQLRTTIEQYETSLEELKASNEELQAINEELRSATEELETSKEELQSVNEELTTVNHELKSKVDEVSHANNDLQNLMMSTDIGVVFLDRELRIKRFTPRAQDLFNLIPSDVGRPLADLTHRLESVELSELAQEVLQSLRVAEREVRSRNGHRYLARLLPYRSIEDRIEGVVLTFVDISDLREAVEGRRRSEAALVASEEKLRFALQSAPIAVLRMDRDATITWAYVHGRELPDPSPARLMFVGDSSARFETAVGLAVSEHGPQHLELDLTIGETERTYEFWIEASGDGVYAVGFDITPTKLAERTLRDTDRRKDEFLATLSHELRNPLTPLKVALDVAKLASDDPDQVQAAHAIIERQVKQISRLVEDLLDLSRITQGKITLDLRPVVPATIVDSAVEAVQPLIDERHHHLTVTVDPTPATISGDPVRLTQLLTNVLSNAAKYTPDGGEIRLTVRVEVARRRLVIAIKDNGVGIAPDVLPHIFEIFVQGREPDGRTRSGLGLGLNLVRQLVELHGGTVTAASAGLGAGSEFVIELPLSAG
jgi:two-component system CheB/CheR fusion protein